ncbi:hypothetical protein predicted by Glimmer/Critica [Lactiplantibacillus plantarum]|nr:hypothetical protein predicted by Glimmer/Critica [Lactiplantibacillus plantarum]
MICSLIKGGRLTVADHCWLNDQLDLQWSPYYAPYIGGDGTTRI